MGVVTRKISDYAADRGHIVAGYVGLGVLQIARTVLIPLLLGWFVQSLNTASKDARKWLLWLVLLYVVSAAVQVGHGMFDAENGTAIFQAVRQQTVEGVLKCFRRNLQGPPAGEIGIKVYQLAEGVYWMSRLITMEIGPAALTIMGVLVYTFCIGVPWLIAATFVFVTLVALMLGLTYHYWLIEHYQTAQNTMDRLYGKFDDQINNLEAIYVGNALHREIEMFRDNNAELRGLYKNVWEGKTYVRFGSAVLVYGFSALVLYMLYDDSQRNSSKALVAAAPLLFLMLRTEAALYALTKGMMQLVYYHAIVRRLDTYFTQMQDGTCRVDAIGAVTECAANVRTVVIGEGGKGLSIETENTTIIDQDTEITINAPVTIVSGEIGSGKSTLARAIAGLQPYTGSIKVHGCEISSTPNISLPNLVYYVPQSPTMFDRTVLENITLGDANIAENDVKAKLNTFFGNDDAATTAFVRRPAGRDGTNLSGGERVVCYVVRALLRRCWVLVLDEPTAALDEVNARALIAFVVTAAVANETQLIVITHDTRPSVKWSETATSLQVAGQKISKK